MEHGDNKYLIRVTGVDLALANLGLVAADVTLEGEIVGVVSLHLIETQKLTTKQVRQNSDDLRRARELTQNIREFNTRLKSAVVMAEIPTGAQSARAATSFGVAIGVIAGVDLPVVEVQPLEVKKASVGSRTASKAEMIDWATTLYPEAPWIRTKRGGQMVITNKNEHLADALAVIHAGVLTQQFKMMAATMRMVQRAA